MTENEVEYSMKIAAYLRENKINTDVFLEDKKLKAKFKYADKLNIPYVAVIGENEVITNKITLKNMQTGEQETLDLKEAIQKLNNII